MTCAGQNQPSFRMLAGKRRGELLLACMLAVFAILLGGGGSPSPMPEMVLQLATAILATVWIWLYPASIARIDKRLVLAALLIVILPVLQLVPLPPDIWQNLPGREAQRIALEIVGADQNWRALSIAPLLTIASLLSLSTPIALMLLASRLSQRERVVLIMVVGVMAALAMVPGVIQVVSGGGFGHFYEQTHRGVVTGFHANRNAAADLLLIGIVATPFLANQSPPQSEKPIAVLLIAMLSVGVLLTQSRTGLAILPVAILAAAIARQLLAHGEVAWKAIIKWGALIGSGFAALIVITLYAGPSRIANALARFSATKDFRSELWQDGWFAASQFWPFGSGVGTIQPVLIAAERLENVDPSTPNRVHNDFLEYAVETGFLGVLVIAGLMAIGLKLAKSASKQGGLQRIIRLFAIFALLALAIHSIMDYPLRSMSLATLAAMAFGLLSPSPSRPRKADAKVRQTDKVS